MSLVDHITIKGFKSIKSIEMLELRAINVVIGPNGAGKSNLLDVFSLLREIKNGRLQEYVATSGGAEKILHFGSKTTDLAEIHLSSMDNGPGFSIGLKPTESDSLFVSSEQVFGYSTGTPLPTAAPRSEAVVATKRRDSYPILEYLDGLRVYHFHDTSSSSPMKKTADINDNGYLRRDASNLAAFLYYLELMHPAEYNLIVRTVRRVAPFVDRFVLEPLRLNPNSIRLEWRHVGPDQYFDAASLSDGTLRFIAQATLLLQPISLRPSVILIDEPELGLHPYAITMLASLIKQAATVSQVIVTTQSPVLLDHFDAEDVLVTDRVDGGTTLTRLKAAPLDKWLDEYSLGQLWEKNELGGRPAAEV